MMQNVLMLNDMFEITVYKSVEDMKNNRILLRAPINCPDTFDFIACINMFKNMYPKCHITFSA